MKTLTAIILDTIFTAISTFILSLVFLSYYFRPPLSIIFSVILSILFAFLFLKLSTDKNRKEKLTKLEKKEKEIMLSQLKLYTKTEQNDFFEKVIGAYGRATLRKNGGLFIKGDNHAVFPFFSYDPLRKSDIVKVFNSIGKNDVAIILSESFPNDVKDFADRFDGRITTESLDKVYLSLKEKDLLPKSKHIFPEKKRYDFSQLKNLLKKKKAKNFLVFGSIFILMSYFAPIKAYYIVCGTLFIFFSLILHFYGSNENKEKN